MRMQFVVTGVLVLFMVASCFAGGESRLDYILLPVSA